MLTTTKGPGDPETWHTDPADYVSIGGDDIANVVALRVPVDPVGRNLEAIMVLMGEESPLDDFETLDASIQYLTQHMHDADFPAVVREALDAAFTSIADQTDTRYELERARRTNPLFA